MTRTRQPSAALRPGDVVRRPKGPVTHYGVVTDRGVLHNSPGRGEHVSTLAEFARGRPVTVERLAESERLRLAARAAPGRARPYHLLVNNCEHTLSRARADGGGSPQLLAFGLAAAGAVGGALLTRHWAGVAAGWALGRRLGTR